MFGFWVGYFGFGGGILASGMQIISCGSLGGGMESGLEWSLGSLEIPSSMASVASMASSMEVAISKFSFGFCNAGWKWLKNA